MAERGVLRNGSATREIAAVDAAQVLAFHRSLPGYERTPLVCAPALAATLGVASVHVKDESNRLSTPSFKILGASWAVFNALCARVGARPEDVGRLDNLRELVAPLGVTLVTATDGNHGRAVARIASSLNLGAQILVPEDMSPARIAGLEEEGARVMRVRGTYDDAVAVSAEMADERHVLVSDTAWDGYEQVPRWVVDGYATIGAEIFEELSEIGAPLPTLVAAQIGVGAFASSVVRSFVPVGARVVGVEPTKAACLRASIEAGRPVRVPGALDSLMAGLNCGIPSRTAWPYLRAGVDAFVTIDDADAAEGVRALSRVGVVSGESGAAGLAGLLAFGQELGLQPTERVLVVSTEGATDPVSYGRIVAAPADRPVVGEHRTPRSS